MTILSPLEGITAPMLAANPAASTPDDDAYEYDYEDYPAYSDAFARDAVEAGPQYIASRRSAGWTPDRQRASSITSPAA